MPSELLVKAQEPYKNVVVNVRPAGWQFGGAETLPSFVTVTVTDGLYSDAVEWQEPWRRRVEMSVDSSTATQATLTFSGDLVRESDGLGKVSQSTIQDLIDNWTMTVDTNGDNAVTCTVSVFDAAISYGYWRFDLSVATFTDLGVVDGWQRIEADYSAAGWAPNVVGMRVAQRGCEVISNDGLVVRFAVPIASLRDSLLADLEDYTETIKKRRWEITDSALQTAIDNGGSLTVTEAQVQSNLVDTTQV